MIQLQPIPIRKSLSKAYLKVKPTRTEIDLFKTNFKKLLGRIDVEESETNVRDHLRDFLREVWYKDAHLTASKGRTDMVIHNEKTAKSTVGVLFEVKRPKNVHEMVSRDNLNAKALHELVLYYLRERHDNNNLEIKNLVITNVYEWFIFDENHFEKLIYGNKDLVKFYEHFKQVGKDNDYFYDNLAKHFIPEIQGKLSFTWFNLKDYKRAAFNESEANDKKLIPLFKILSPAHLLKLPFANDSNTLDKRFYNELLHIIGLEEKKEKGKKLIQRKTPGERQTGALIENAIASLKADDKLWHVPNLSSYGATGEEQLFGVALELCITWLNRIFFLKLR